MGKRNQVEFKEASVEFSLNNKTKIKFIVVHNMPDTFGLSFECAVNNWLPRAKEYTAEDLCEYIMSKSHMHDGICLTQEQFKKVTKNL